MHNYVTHLCNTRFPIKPSGMTFYQFLFVIPECFYRGYGFKMLGMVGSSGYPYLIIKLLGPWSLAPEAWFLYLLQPCPPKT
jgi:hypothetical protein